MLKRIYIDNFRCFVNFELKLNAINLMLGSNGSGKTSIFDVLQRIQEFVIGNARVYDLFPVADLTRWQLLDQQRFELELLVDNDSYLYSLLIEHDSERKRMRVLEEKLDMNGKPLFVCHKGQAQLFRDDHSPGPQYPFDWTLSAVATLHERPENKKLTRFKRQLAKIIIVRPIPALVEKESRGEQERLHYRMENFLSWYRHLSQEHTAAIFFLFQQLQSILPGFVAMRLKGMGEEARALKVLFSSHSEQENFTFDFHELSDGQKMLIMIYSLILGMQGEKLSLFIDEPDNFLSLREIQPWLSHLIHLSANDREQAVLVSHHPEIVNYLGCEYGHWLQREQCGPVRVGQEPPQPVAGLTLAETFGRGWEQ
ncbi:MAG: AAA family ATPase [Magnetococcales bacterium]|nr:AAA family ATPase [Magnetococcales bacterium]